MLRPSCCFVRFSRIFVKFSAPCPENAVLQFQMHGLNPVFRKSYYPLVTELTMNLFEQTKRRGFFHLITVNYSKKTRTLSIVLPFLLVFALSFTACESGIGQSEDAIQQTDANESGYIINDNSAVRFEPHLFSARVDNLNKGDKVTIVGRSSEKSRIAKMENYWLHIITPSGICAWTFGGNVKLISDSDDETQKELDRLANERKDAKLAKDFKGVWWSVNSKGDVISSHKLTMYEDHTYKSERGGQKFEGKWSIDFDLDYIMFSEGTTGGDKFSIIERGTDYFFERNEGQTSFRMRKIKDDTDLDEEKKKKEEEELFLQLNGGQPASAEADQEQ